MSKFAKSALLSLGLIAGATASAFAQSNNIAALPPNAPPATAVASYSPVAPSPKYVGPKPSGGWYAHETQTQPVQPSPQYVGPKPSGGWYAHETQTQPVQPSPQYVGPKPN